MAASLGHTIVPTTPALAPLAAGRGLPPRGCPASPTTRASIAVERAGGRSRALRGSLLWTHFGISGPAALDASRHWHRAALDGGRCASRLSFAARPRRSPPWSGGCSMRPPRDPGRHAADALAALAPRGRGGCAPRRRWRSTRRIRLAQLPARRAPAPGAAPSSTGSCRVTGSRGYNYAEATAGGVALDEIDRGHDGVAAVPGAVTSSARCWTWTAGSAASTSSGPGRAPGWPRAACRPDRRIHG